MRTRICWKIPEFLPCASIGIISCIAMATVGQGIGMYHPSRTLGTTIRLTSIAKASAPPAQAGIAVPVNAWTTFQTNGFPAEIVGYDATVYASSIKRHIVLGKYHHYSSEPNYCMDGWSWDENRWDILDCGAYFHTEHSMEGGHPVGAFVYMPNRDSIVYWGGQSGSNQPEQAFHTWWWDVVGRTGRDKLSASRPGNIKVSAMAYDQSRDKAVFYPDASHSVEIYDPKTNTWATPSVTGTPPPTGLAFPTLEWDSTDYKTYLFGGAAGNNCATGLKFNNNIYTFDPGSNKWTELTVTPDPVYGSPMGRWYTGFAYDADDNIFLVAGGQYCNAGSAVGLTDTWKFDPGAGRWTKLSPTTNYQLHTPYDAPFQKLRYDPDHRAFVMILPSYDHQASTGGTWGNYSARVWVYCYSVSCPHVGTTAYAYPAPSDSLNRNGGQPITAMNQTWASDTTIATYNNSIYAAWIETSLPFVNGTCVFHHPYVQATNNGTSWTNLGADCSALDSNVSNWERDGEKPSLAVVNGTPWVAWAESIDASANHLGISAKYWNGSRWIGGPIGTRNSAPRGFQGISQLISVGPVPTIGFIENNKSGFPDITEAYVDQYKDGAWLPLGGKLNADAAGRIEFLAIASDGSKTLACWTEEIISKWTHLNPSQLHCAAWTGSTWKRVGSSLNGVTANWAAEVSVAYLDGRFYVAWAERTTAGNEKLYVRVLDGSSSALLGGGPMNKNASTGWVFHPRLASDETNLYLSWEEQLSLGQPSRLYVSKWDGRGWSALGGALNIDPGNGSAAHSSMALMNGFPVVIWTEGCVGQLQQTYAKRWNGSSWVLLPNRRSQAVLGLIETVSREVHRQTNRVH